MALTESQNSERLERVPLAGLTAHIRAWLNDSSDRSVAQKVAGAAFLIRVFSAALIYASQILFARWMGSFEFGIYVYVWTWVLLIGDLADLGLASAAQRFIPQYARQNAPDKLRGFLARSRWFAVGSASAIAIVGVSTVKLLEPFLADYVVVPLMIGCAVLPFYSLMQMQDGIARSYNWIHLALLPPYIVRHVVMLALVAAAFFMNFPTTAQTAVTAVAISFALTVVGQTFVLNRKLRRTVAPGPKAYEPKAWFKISLPILMVEGFYLLLTNTDILVLQQFRSPEDVALYYAAAKTLTLIAFVHFAVSAAVAHRFSEYHVTEDHARLEQILGELDPLDVLGFAGRHRRHPAIGKPLLSLFGGVRRRLLSDVHPGGRAAGARRGRPGRAAAQHAGRAARLRRSLWLGLRAQSHPLHRADPAARHRRRRGFDRDRADRRIRAAVLGHQAPARLPRLHLGPPLKALARCTPRSVQPSASNGAGFRRSATSPSNGGRSPRARSNPTCSTSRPSALAAAPVFGADAGAMLVWSTTGRLLGLFPARIERGRGPLARMVGWTHPFAPLGTPLVDRDHAEP